MRRENICKLLLFTILLCVLSGCKERPLKFSVRFDALGDLKADGPVYFEETPIGHIEKVVSTDSGDYLVKVSIDPEYKGKATENSKFFISEAPSDAGYEALVIEQDPPGGAVLKGGSIVQGEKRQGCFDRFMTHLKKSTEDASMKLQGAMQSLQESLKESAHNFNQQLEESLQDIDRYFQDFDNSRDYTLNEEELEKLQQAVNDFIEAFNRSSADMQKQLREKVLPELRRNLENLKNRLKNEGNNDESEKIDHQINEMLEV